MSRIKQIQNIDSLISCIHTIIENQGSLSEKDVEILNGALNDLRILKRKKGKTNEQILKEVVEIVKLLTQFFLKK